MIKVKKALESGGTFLMFFNKCLFMCLHVEVSSERLFNFWDAFDDFRKVVGFDMYIKGFAVWFHVFVFYFLLRKF